MEGYFNADLAQPEGVIKKRKYYNGLGGGGIRGHVGKLFSATAPLVSGWKYMEHGQVGEDVAVPDGLHPRNRLPYIQECVRLGLNE